MATRPFPRTLPEFQAVFPDEAACRRYLVERRWPNGFRCPCCDADEGWERSRSVFICRRCRTETSVTAATILDHTHLPLVTWFRAAYLIATTPGLNALSLGRHLGLTSRKTTHAVMRRLRRSMSALALPRLAGTVETDGAISCYKRWQRATYHKPPADDAPYLDEFCFRSEFRGDPEAAFSTLLGLAVGAPRLDRRPTAPEPPVMTSAVRPIPTREQRVAARRVMLDFSMRRQRPGSGSMLHELMKGTRPAMEWWRQAAATPSAKRIPIAVTGANAANAYMPPRATGDLDLALRVGDLAAAGEALTAAGWEFLGNLQLYEDLRGSAWRKSGNELDLIGLPGEWGRDAIRDAQDNLLVAGLPTLTLPYLVVMKLISARPQDSADISRMVGPASEPVLNQVRAVVRRWRPQDTEELEQLIALGKLEWGTAPPTPRNR